MTWHYPNIDPVALAIGSVRIHWYGLMYALSIGLGWWLMSRRAHRAPYQRLWETTGHIEDLVFYLSLGLLVGGRIGYFVFYQPHVWVTSPRTILKVWEGGMSFHGGLVGAIVALLLFAYRYQKGFLQVTDFVAPFIPIGLGAGRIGNFINGELWGRVAYDVPWAMIFPSAGPLPRHPSQLYEFLLEGVLLWILLNILARLRPPRGSVSAAFLVGYGACRILAEFFRAPDRSIGFIAGGWLTMGQMLSIPMVLLGVGLLVWSYTHSHLTLANGLRFE